MSAIQEEQRVPPSGLPGRMLRARDIRRQSEERKAQMVVGDSAL